MKEFNYSAEMIKYCNQKGFYVSGQTVFKGTELAGSWDYKFHPGPDKKLTTPVVLDLILKYRE